MNDKTTIREIRYHNARLLQESVGGQKSMIEITGKSQAQISSILGTNPSKGIGNNLARELEQTFNKPTGWLDIWHDTLTDNPANVQEEKGTYMDRIQLNQDHISLSREIIFNIERRQFILTADQKARLITGVFASCTNHNITANDLSDAIIDSARISIL